MDKAAINIHMQVLFEYKFQQFATKPRSVVTGLCKSVNLLSCVQLFASLWTVARQAPLSIGFSRQEYWSG